jgi:hypothetical protein
MVRINDPRERIRELDAVREDLALDVETQKSKR